MQEANTTQEEPTCDHTSIGTIILRQVDREFNMRLTRGMRENWSSFYYSLRTRSKNW